MQNTEQIQVTYGIKCFETGEEWRFDNEEDMRNKLEELESTGDYE